MRLVEYFDLHRLKIDLHRLKKEIVHRLHRFTQIKERYCPQITQIYTD